MPWIKATDIAYGRFRAPDLDVMEEFLTRFGLVRSERTPTALYMRGTDPPHHIHITEKGEPKVVGLAYYAPSEGDLARLAKAPGASAVESIDEPGGGKRVRLTEPNGYQIEVVHGIATLLRFCLETARFSRTVRLAKIRRPCGTKPTPLREIASGESLPIVSPNSRISPARGGRKPMIALMHVVFPAPLRPSNASTRPAFSENDMPCSTWLSP